MISLICGIKKKPKKKTPLKPPKLTDTESRLVAARNGGWGERVKGAQRHKLFVVNCLENVVGSVATAANMTVLRK